MGFWSKFYLAGTRIATDALAGVEVYISMVQDVPLAVLKQTATGVMITASQQRIFDISDDLTFEVIFSESDLDNFATDSALRRLFDAGAIAAAYLGNNEVLGNWYPAIGFPVVMVPSAADIFAQINSWKPAESYTDLRPVGNPLIVQVNAVDGVPDRLMLDYKMEIRKPVFPGSSVTELIDTLSGTEAPARVENGITYLDGWEPEIGWYLDGFLDFTPPTVRKPDIIVNQLTTMPFFVTTWVEQDGVEVAGSRSASETIWAIKARVGEEDFAGWKRGIFGKYIGENGRWLTWQPNGMLVDENTPVYQSFLINRNPVPTRVRVYVQLNFANNAVDYFEHTYIDDIGANSVITVPMGYKELNLAAHVPANNELTHYTVWLVDESFRRISRKRRFEMDYRIYGDVRHVIFQNSLGGFDTVRMLGTHGNEVQVSGRTGMRGLAANYLTTDEEGFVRNKIGQETITLSTSMLPKKWIDYLQDLLWSERVLLETKAGFVAVMKADDTYTRPNWKEYLSGRTFSFRKSKDAVGFSYLPKGVESEDRPTVWIGQQPYCLIDANSGKRTGRQAFATIKLFYVDVSPPEAVRGAAAKANSPGTVGYVAPILSGDCASGTADFYNVAINRESTFSRNNCDPGFAGSAWSIIVAANAFGGNTQAEANARAEAEYARLNTQTNANINGSCTLYTAGLLGNYFNYVDGTKNDANFFDPPYDATRTDLQLDFSDFIINRPSGVNNSLFGVFWEGKVIGPATGLVTFAIQHDDGVRLYIDGVLVMNVWEDGSTNHEANVAMQAGRFHDIRLEYYNRFGGAVLKMNWRYAGQSQIAVPAANLKS